MNVNCSNEQIVSLYESSEGSLSIEQIAEAFDNMITPTAIKLALASGSKLYKSKLRSDEVEFSGDDKEEAKQVLRSLMRSADSDVVKFRAANLIYDEATGKRDHLGIAKQTNFSVTLINQQLIEARRAIEHSKEKVVDIDPRHAHLANIDS